MKPRGSARSIFLKLSIAIALLMMGHFFTLSLAAQKRDSLTEMEAELVRETQEIDQRIALFIKVIDRRFLLLENPSAAQSAKELEKLGELPKGTRAQLLRDIERLLDESINNIDETASRDMKNKLLPKALKILVAGCKGFLPKLQALSDKAAEKTESASLFNAIEYCNQIIEAEGKVAEPESKGKT